MKAAVCNEFGSPLTLEEVSIDPPRVGEVKVRMAAAGICHSDIHQIRGEWGGETPLISGHEAAGVVEEVGEGVTLAHPGDRVVVSLLRSCGRCYYCAHGMTYACNREYSIDSDGRLHDGAGTRIHRGLWVGSFAEYAIVDESQVVSIPDDFPMECAALLACGVITGLGAVVNTARVEVGCSVAVIGCGGVGLNAVQGAVLSGANPIVGIDVLDSKLNTARAFGATHAVNARADDVLPAVLDLTGGLGVDYAFVTVGSSQAASLAIDLIRVAGTAVLVGMPPKDGPPLALSVHHVAGKGKRILGSNMGSTRLSQDVPRLIGLYRSGRLKLDELITSRYPLDRINEAIESTESGEAIRNVITFSVPGQPY